MNQTATASVKKPELRDYINWEPNAPRQIDSLSDIQAKLDDRFISHWISGEDNPISLCITTDHTHQMALGANADIIIAQHQYNLHLQHYFHAYPVLENAKSCLWAHPRPHRFRILREVIDKIVTRDTEALAEFILSVYVDTEIFDREYAIDWRNFLMDHAELLRAASIPVKKLADDTPLTIYHGIEYDGTDDSEWYPATAWTLDKDIAVKFAKRFAKSPREVLAVTSSTRDLYTNAMFYTNARNEQELYFHSTDDLPEAKILVPEDDYAEPK